MLIVDEKYLWTQHSRMKMRHYHLTESRVKRIIRHPTRVEEGIIENAIAVMSPAGGKNYSEIWALYVLTEIINPPTMGSRPGYSGVPLGLLPHSSTGLRPWYSGGGINKGKRIKIITAWRYPGRAPERDPVPQSILGEIKTLL